MLIFIAEDMVPFSSPVRPSLVCQRREWHAGIINILTVLEIVLFQFACLSLLVVSC